MGGFSVFWPAYEKPPKIMPNPPPSPWGLCSFEPNIKILWGFQELRFTDFGEILKFCPEV